MTLKTFLIAALALLSAGLRAEFTPALQVDLRARYSDQNNPEPPVQGQPMGHNADVFMIPAWKSGSLSVLPVLAYLSQGQGNESVFGAAPDFKFVRRNTFLAKPTLRWDAGTLTYKGWLGAKRAVNAEQHDTAWSLGLYDWEEFGGGLGADIKLGGAVKKVGASLDYHHRTYMNWHESGTLVVGGKNYYSKDYNGLKLGLDAEGEALGLGWASGLAFLMKGFTDSYALTKVSGPNGETTNGVLDIGKLKAENLLRFSLDLSRPLNERWQLALDYAFDWNMSNQHFFDPVFNRGVLDFYGYQSHGVGLGASWRPRGAEGLALRGRAGVSNRSYTGRFIRNDDGSYAQGKQADVEQRFSLDAECPVWLKGLAVVGGASYSNNSTNTGFSNGLLVNYDLIEASLGLRYQM